MQPGADYFELSDYVGVLRRRWLTVLGFTLIGVVLAGTYYYVAPRSYAATVLVQVNALQTTANALGGRTSGPVNMDNENQIVQSAAVATIAKAQLRSPLSVTGLLQEIKVAVPPNTTFLQITCSAPSADLAQRCANAFGRAYLYNRRATALKLITSGINELLTQATALEARIEALRAKTGRHGLPASAARGVAELELTAKLARLSTIQSKIDSATPLQANLAAKNTAVGDIVTPAAKPSAPANPKKKLLLPSGLAAGLVLGLAIAFIRDWRRPRIYSARDIQRRADLPAVFSLVEAAKGGLVFFAPPRSRAGQVFTELAQYAGATLGDGHHVLLVTRTAPASGGIGSDGTVAANLAAALARTRGETVLICADPHGLRLPRLLGADDSLGFAELLAGTATIGDVKRGIADLPSLAVITPGLGAADAQYNTRYDVLQQIMRELRRDVRYVVIDVPPLDVDADAFSLAEFADAAILTVPARTTHPAEVTDCVQRLERMRTAILAAVLILPTRRSYTTRKRRADVTQDERTRASYARPPAHSAVAYSSVAQLRLDSSEEPSSTNQPVIRPVARRTSAPGESSNGGSRYAAPSRTAGASAHTSTGRPEETPVGNSGSSSFASAWTPRSVSESWPLPPTSPTDEEEADLSDPLIGN